MKTVNKEMKLIYRKSNEISKYKYKRIQNAFWLSSFIAIFMPCCYTKPLEITTISMIEQNKNILKRLGKDHNINFFLKKLNEPYFTS